MNHGKFVISLDFELMWGVRDKKSQENYGKNILGVHEVMPKLMKLFDDYKLKVTVATVGFLFFESKSMLLKKIPNNLPNYDNSNLSPYINYIYRLNENEEDKYHFAPTIIKELHKKGHQICSHTFSHYYCLEEGQTIDSFEEDLKKSIETAADHGIEISSIIFPRNQYNNEYLKICTKLGIQSIRGNEEAWYYKATNSSKENIIRRLYRILDSYINISGHNCYSNKYMSSFSPINIPSSRFLRPYSRHLAFLDFIKLKRIKKSMTYAAKNNLTFHIWWHPHNFGINQSENLLQLEKILKHYSFLNKKFGFTCVTMECLSKKLLNAK